MENLDPEEHNKFAALAADWWDRDGPSRTLHDINPCRLSYIEAHTPLAQRCVADIGCGGGILSLAMARAGATVTALDASAELIKVAQQQAASDGINITFEHGLSREFASRHAQHFDVVTCMELIEHVPDGEALLADCVKLLKPGGWLFVSTLTRKASAYALGIVAAEYVLGLVPRGTHNYQQFVRPSELAGALRTMGMHTRDISAMHYNPLSRARALRWQTLRQLSRRLSGAGLIVSWSRPQAILFDLDGTLLDTAPALARALNRVLEENARPPLDFAAIRPYVSHGSIALTRLGFPESEHTPQFETLRQRLLDCYHNDVAYRTTMFAGMPRVLAQIEANRQPWGIVTNKPGWLTTPLLNMVTLPTEPACVLSGDSAARAKPHPGQPAASRRTTRGQDRRVPLRRRCRT